MGCANSRTYPEEVSIETHSIKTGFEPHTVKAAASTIRAHSTARFILNSHFRAISRELSLNAKPSDQPALKAFYDKLASSEQKDIEKVKTAYVRLSDADLTQDTLIREEELVVLAILLTRSSAYEKAIWLFQEFDDGCTDSLSSETIHHMFEIVFKVALDDLPSLMKNQGSDVKQYLAKGELYIQKAIEKILEVVISDKSAGTVSKEKFGRALAEFKGGVLLTAGGLREFAVDIQAGEKESQDKAAKGDPKSEHPVEETKPQEPASQSTPIEESKQT